MELLASRPSGVHFFSAAAITLAALGIFGCSTASHAQALGGFAARPSDGSGNAAPFSAANKPDRQTAQNPVSVRGPVSSPQPVNRSFGSGAIVLQAPGGRLPVRTINPAMPDTPVFLNDNGSGHSYAPSSPFSPGASSAPQVKVYTYDNNGNVRRRFGPAVGGGSAIISAASPPFQATVTRNDYGSDGNRRDRSPVRVTTPTGRRDLDRDGDYVYRNDNISVYSNGPVFLGGYYYPNYCEAAPGPYIYPSVYSAYIGFPQSIFSNSVTVVDQPYYPSYCTPYLPYYTPTYQVTYNQINYYVGSEERAGEIESGGDHAKQALKNAYADGTFQAAFADIAKAWNDGNIALIRKHLRDNDTKISVLLKKKYSYSINSSDFGEITRDAMDRLTTVSFEFTRVRKAKNGDVTAYGKHVYRTSDSSQSGDSATLDNTVPLDQSGSDPYDKSNDPAVGEEKTIYVSYTLRHHDDEWYIVMIDSSQDDLIGK